MLSQEVNLCNTLPIELSWNLYWLGGAVPFQFLAVLNITIKLYVHLTNPFAATPTYTISVDNITKTALV